MTPFAFLNPDIATILTQIRPFDEDSIALFFCHFTCLVRYDSIVYTYVTYCKQ